MPAITNNTELIEACRRNNIPLVGVYYKDQLPSTIKNGCYIFNLANSDDGTGGTHWTGAVIQGRQVCYFDSFGKEPPYPISFFFSNHQVQYNPQQVQSIASGVCGYYVLYFLFYMTHRQMKCPDIFCRFQFFLKLWDNDPEKNREILSKKLLPVK